MNRFSFSLLVLSSLLLCVSGQANAQTSAEAQRFAAELAYADANKDGSIDALELADAQQMAAMLLMLDWNECDRDDDGKLTPTEFQSAATEAMQELLSANSESEQQAEEALAEAVPVELLLEQLGRDESYSDELAALREAVEDIEDDEAVVTHVFSNPTLYPRLYPVVNTWTRYYPVKPGLRKYVHPRPWHLRKPAKSARPHVIKPKHGPKPGKPHAGKPGKPKVSKPAKPAKPSRPAGRPRR